MTAGEAFERAESLLRSRDLARAIVAFDDAERAGADADQCAAWRWQACMLRGDFSAAWCESDAIRQRGKPDPHRFWNGEDICGRRVMLRCLHGFGDTVQFLRYLPRLRALASSVVVEVPPAMVELARCFAGAEEVITWGASAPVVAPEWEVQIEVTELPYLFRTALRELPLAVRYVRLPADLPEENRSDALDIGLVWSSGEWNPSRSIPIELLGPIAAMEGCRFWNLQGAKAHEDWARLRSAQALDGVLPAVDSILRLAEVTSQLDLVITTDTLAAHLAGALGIEAWVMLEYAADWRWMHGRADSPWYPTLRLFRQRIPGYWHSVVDEIGAALEKRSLAAMSDTVA